MTYLHFFIEANRLFLMVMAVLYGICGMIILYTGTSSFKNIQIVEGGLNGILIASIMINALEPIHIILKVIILMIGGTFAYYLNNRNAFFSLFTTSTTMGAIIAFILTAGAVGSPEAAIPSALFGGLVVGFISVVFSHQYPLLFISIKGAAALSFIVVVLSSNIYLFILIWIILTIANLYHKKNTLSKNSLIQ